MLQLLLIILGLVLIIVSSAWVSQSQGALFILAGLWGGVVFFAIWVKRRAVPTSHWADKATQFEESPSATALTSTHPEVINTVPTILQSGFYLFLVSFAIGWREFWITNQLKIHPSEMIIWGLFFLFVAQKKRPTRWSIPGSIKALLILGIVGLFTALINKAPFDIILSEFKLLLVIIPVFYITREVVNNYEDWRKIFLIQAFVICYISLLGIIEFFLPNLIPTFLRSGAYFGDEHILYTHQGFARAIFTFWGTPLVSVYLSIMFVPLLGSAAVERSPIWRIFLYLTIILCTLAIYIAGGRGPWLATVASLALYVFLSPRMGWLKVLLFIVVIYYTVLYFFPAVALNNLYSAFTPEEYYDTSAIDRTSRIETGINLIKQSPLIGYGWGGSGWIHSDLIQIGANLGLPALFFFLYWYLIRIWQLYTMDNISMRGGEVYRRVLLAGLGAALFHLATQALIVLPFLIIPLWFFAALADQFFILAEHRSE